MAHVTKVECGRISLHVAVTAVPILFILPDQRLYIANIISLHTHISDCVKIVYELPKLPNNTALGVKHFYTNRKPCELLTGYLSFGRCAGGDGQIRDIGQKFWNLLFKQEAVAAPGTATFPSLLHSSRKTL
jgi:hypothetical protein